MFSIKNMHSQSLNKQKEHRIITMNLSNSNFNLQKNIHNSISRTHDKIKGLLIILKGKVKIIF